MKLKVLFLSFLLAFGLLFSTATTTHAATTAGMDISGAFSRIKEIFEVLTAREKVDADSSSNTLQSTVSEQNRALQADMNILLMLDENSALANVSRGVAMMYEQPPASGEIYVADLLYNMKIGPVQPAYAQVGGLGFSALEPVLYAWKQFRNMAYLFFIIITLVIGFMIMMRQKIGSQAAVTAQQAIPQIVIALITVTFSYAIAGFLIDMMYVMMFLFVGLFVNEVPELDGILAQNLVDIAGGLFAGSVGIAQTAVQDFIAAELANVTGGDAIAWISGVTFALVIAFAYLFAMIQLFFELLKTYIAIVVSIVLSPLLLMLGALPGKSDVFQDWVKGLIANLAAFPVFLLLIVIHKLLTHSDHIDGGFLPPFLIGRGDAGPITSMIGLAIMLISKDLIVQAKKSFNPKGTGIFEQFGQALSKSVAKGWKGGELIPGVGFTDTNKLPGVGKYIGSGQKAASLGVSGISGAASGVFGGGFDYARDKFQTKGSPTGGSYRQKPQTYFTNRFSQGVRGAANTMGYDALKGKDKEDKSK